MTQTYLHALLLGKRRLCGQLMLQYQETHALQLPSLYEQLFRWSLYRVGELWEQNKISVATEHLATAITEGLMSQLYAQLSPLSSSNQMVVVSCIEEEMHQIGARMISDLFELYGWKSYFLGANTPTRELLRFLDELQPDLLALSLSIYFHLPQLQNLLQLLRSHFPQLPVILGGQGFRHGGADLLQAFPRTRYLPSLQAFEQFLQSPQEAQ